MENDSEAMIDWGVFAASRDAMGGDFARIFGYFREDGANAIAEIENALRSGDAVGMIMPADTLRDGAQQFGAQQLVELAEEVEEGARTSLEHHQRPDEFVAQVVKLRQLFEQSVAEIDRASNPLVQRGGGAKFAA